MQYMFAIVLLASLLACALGYYGYGYAGMGYPYAYTLMGNYGGLGYYGNGMYNLGGYTTLLDYYKK